VLTKLRAKAVVVATGTQEIPDVFEKNDLPGIILSSGLQRLIHLYGINPGSSALITTSTDAGYHTAIDLMNQGVRIAAIADSRANFPDHLQQAVDLQSEGVLILTAHAASRAEGGRHVIGGVVARIVNGKLTTEERQFDCDIFAMSGGYQPASWLLEQTGASLSYDDSIGERVPRTLPASVFVTGEITGTHELNTLLVQGRQSGTEAANKALGKSINSDHHETQISVKNSRPISAPPPVGLDNAARRFVCFCEDLTAKDIEQGIDEGFRDIQTLKRYSTVTMGPCQGKMCLKAVNRMTAERTGATIDEIGVTTARPPVQPVPLGALAGPSHIPIKRSPIFAKHLEMSAEITDMSPWQRAYSYSSPQEECMAVRERVGIIDVSTLGKIYVQGKDSGTLLDKLYTHRFSDLRQGRVRYGIICSDDGTIIDDGTVARITDDRYFITTSTGNIELVEEWMKWWMAGTNMCVHVTNVTSGYAAINVAGPHARETLSKLTDIDITADNFRYMRFKSGTVAGVPAMFLRIGFVGELSWELHFPAEYGEYMWDALMEAGREYGISPFGVEAQRILRLEKKHIIVAQDTDAVTNPLETDSAWAVKFDKEDFIGKGSIAAAGKRGLKKRLVGFIIQGSMVVPKDGDPVVIGDQPIGHVTSSRMSPTMGRGFGLAWVPSDFAEENREIFIRVGRQNFSANVTLKPIYDPEGKRLRT
jgi:sarcosine oxidase subunit alpha